MFRNIDFVLIFSNQTCPKNQLPITQINKAWKPELQSYDLLTFLSRWTIIFFLWNRYKHLHMFQPSAVPLLICYLLSSWLVIFHPQVEPSTSAWEGATEHLCSSMLIWLRLVHHVHQLSFEASLLYLHTTTPLILLINLQMWHLSPKCTSLN